MTEYFFPEGGVWVAPSGTNATVTPRGCYAETVRVDRPLTVESARELLLRTPGRMLGDPAVEREVARQECAVNGWIDAADSCLDQAW
jgi:hypothetical protein